MSNNLLPSGSVNYLFFCVSKFGWGWDKFISEANEGKGIKVPKSIRFSLTYFLPVIIVGIFIIGYIDFFKN